MPFTYTRHTHSDRLERWLGARQVAQLVLAMRDWYGPPVAVQGVPGNVRATRGGDFVGHIDAGHFGTAFDRAEDAIRRLARTGQRRRAAWAARQLSTAGMGFSSFADYLAEASAGKQRTVYWQKTGPTGVTSVTSSLWRLGSQPAAGSAGSAAPGGRALTASTTGALLGLDNVSTDTRHFANAWAIASVANNVLLIYDRIFDVAKTMNSNATESVTGTPSRYQSSTASAADFAGGNFAFVEVGGTALAATGHNWTTCLYRNQAGTDNQTFPSLTGNSGAVVDRLDHPTNSWFMPLATGDYGVMDLAQMQCSAAVATGAINFVIGHPIAFLPCPVAGFVTWVDGLSTAFNQTRVFDDAALALLEINKPSTTATTYNGAATFVHG